MVIPGGLLVGLALPLLYWLPADCLRSDRRFDRRRFSRTAP